MKKLVAVLACLPLLFACQLQDQARSALGIKPTPAPVPACAQLVVRALVDAQQVVPGAYACLSPDGQQEAAAVNIGSDQDFLAFAQQPPVMDAVHFVSIVHGSRGDVWYSFRATGHDHSVPAGCIGILMAADGVHVAAFSTADVSSGAC